MSTGPRAFSLDGQGPAAPAIVPQPDDAVLAADGVPVLPPPRQRMPWGAILAGSVGALASLAVGLAVERFVSELFATAPALGWVAAGLAALAGLALLAIVARELAGVWRERRIETLRRDAAVALQTRDAAAAKTVARGIADLYAGRGRVGPGPGVRDVEDEIIDADDRLKIAERTLVAPRDAEARLAVAAAARQVAAVTALSPRAIVDVAFVIFAAARLLRRIAGIYGGRPGVLGGLRLMRAALNHLAVTGSVAAGDSLLQSVLGLGLAARVSAKLGEGVLNGLMTARFGLACIEVCRPLPFVGDEPPRLADVASGLLTRSDTAA